MQHDVLLTTLTLLTSRKKMIFIPPSGDKSSLDVVVDVVVDLHDVVEVSIDDVVNADVMEVFCKIFMSWFRFSRNFLSCRIRLLRSLTVRRKSSPALDFRSSWFIANAFLSPSWRSETFKRWRIPRSTRAKICRRIRLAKGLVNRGSSSSSSLSSKSSEASTRRRSTRAAASFRVTIARFARRCARFLKFSSIVLDGTDSSFFGETSADASFGDAICCSCW